MDSCQLLNFLFGPKRATTELNKCFSSLSETATRRSRGRRAENQPLSPLKQLQRKLASLTSGTKKTERKRSVSCDAKCGTYRATLVKASAGAEEIVAECPVKQLLNYDSLNSAESDQVDEVRSGEQVENRDSEYGCLDPLIDASPVEPDAGTHKPVLISKSHQDVSEVNQTNQNKRAHRIKQVVLYSHDEESQDDKNIVASTEVYNMISKFSEVSLKRTGTDHISREDGIKPDLMQAKFAAHDSRVPERNQRIQRTEIDELNPRDQRRVYVRNLVRSIESKGSFEAALKDPTGLHCSAETVDEPLSERDNAKVCGFTKPVTFVKPLPPKTPPKTKKAKCLNIQISLNKPVKIQQLFQDEQFLTKLFDKLQPLDRCVAAQVCRTWRNILYANQNYWKDLVNVIDCTQLRREHLAECIMATLHSAKVKQQRAVESERVKDAQSQHIFKGDQEQTERRCSADSDFFDFDQGDVWVIQELCNRFTHRSSQTNSRQPTAETSTIQPSSNFICGSDQQNNCLTTSKSASIPSQISSTLSSVSISSLLSPLSESNRIENIRKKLYTSIDNRGFDAICLFGATDDDIQDLVCKVTVKAQRRIIVGRLNNCGLTNAGLELFISTFNQVEELEISGCNEITNSFDLFGLQNIRRLTITDCINIADGIAQKLIQILPQLDELTIQAYHLTDAFLEYLSVNSDTLRLRRLEMPDCKELTNQSLVTIARHFTKLEALSLSGSTKISDEGIEILAEHVRQLKSLDLSWCTRITDASLECIACDLGDSLNELVLDRNMHITDTGLGHLATMNKLVQLHIRWCPRITDVGLESIMRVKSLRHLSVAGLHQITARSLLCLVEMKLDELELTNCPAVSNELVMFLSARLPRCNIIF